jgi:hypothetical protein
VTVGMNEGSRWWERGWETGEEGLEVYGQARRQGGFRPRRGVAQWDASADSKWG